MSEARGKDRDQRTDGKMEQNSTKKKCLVWILVVDRVKCHLCDAIYCSSPVQQREKPKNIYSLGSGLIHSLGLKLVHDHIGGGFPQESQVVQLLL